MNVIEKIFNYNDIDYIVKESNNEYKFYYKDNNILIELLDNNILEKLITLLKLAMR